MASIGPLALGAKGCVERLYRFAQGAADWRSGPRWSILSVLCPVHPFASSRHFPSRGNEGSEEKNSESYTSRTISAFSPFGGERSEPITRMLIMLYDTGSQSRNVLASPLGEEGHEVAKGVQANWIHRGAPRPANPVRRHPAKSVWTVVILIMILDVDVTAAGGIIKLIARKGNPQPSAPQTLSPLERSDAQPFYTTCGEAAPPPFLT